jgi:hypothetical protein
MFIYIKINNIILIYIKKQFKKQTSPKLLFGIYRFLKNQPNNKKNDNQNPLIHCENVINPEPLN